MKISQLRGMAIYHQEASAGHYESAREPDGWLSCDPLDDPVLIIADQLDAADHSAVARFLLFALIETGRTALDS